MKQKKRSEINIQDTWDLTPIFKTKEEFLSNYQKFEEEYLNIFKYKNHILDNSKSMLEFLELSDELERKLYKLYYYAHLNFDVDTTNNESQKMLGMVDNIMVKYNEATSFVLPELLKSDYEKVLKYLSVEPNLKKYQYNLEKIYRYKSHNF